MTSNDDGAQSPLEPTTRIETVEMHTGGEAVRIVAKGYPKIPGATILEKRRYAERHLDFYRRLLMWEPRGHFDMYGVLPVEPDLPEADMAVLFIHNEGYSTMCGHATIALGRYALDCGIAPAQNGISRLRLQCPCGLVEVETKVGADGRAGDTSFLSVPAFAFALDRAIDIPGKGRIEIDVGYGGAFYAFAPAEAFGLDVRRSPTRHLVEAADALTNAAKAAIQLDHPDSPDLAFFYGTILTDGRSGLNPNEPSANICVFAKREVDRSPTGSGATARVALLAARGQIAPGQGCVFESITGSIFRAELAERTKAGRFPSIRARVSGRAHYSGQSIFTVEADDPLLPGFLLH